MGVGAARTRRVKVVRGKRSQDPSAREIARAALRARTNLVNINPDFSAKKPAGRVMVCVLLVAFVLSVSHFSGLPIGHFTWAVCLVLLFLFGIVRTIAALTPIPCALKVSPQSDLDVVPEWSILIALYKEADSVPSLLAALSNLEWNKKRLDIIFACERDDCATLEVLSALRAMY